MPDGTAFVGYYEITDQTPTDTNYECSCGVLVWDAEAHKDFHRSLGQIVTDKREPR